MKKPHIHESHPAVITRLKKANGHLNSTIEMLVEGRTCLDVAQQLQAVEAALPHATNILLPDHLHHHLENKLGAVDKDQQNSIKEFKEITRYL